MTAKIAILDYNRDGNGVDITDLGLIFQDLKTDYSCAIQRYDGNTHWKTAEDYASFCMMNEVNVWYPIYQLILREQTETLKLVMRRRFPQYFGLENTQKEGA